MEVSGKKQVKPQRNVPSKGSSGGTSISIACQPCASEGENQEAEGFCQNCQEYLCTACIRYHRKTTLTKHHIILDKENMPKNTGPQKSKQICTKTCEKHTLEVIKFFCRDHDTVGCSNCMVIEHKACKVDFIPDVAEEFANGEEYKNILSKLGGLQVHVTSMKEAVKKGRQASAEMYTEAVNEIKKCRKEMEGYLDKMERLMMAECDRLKKGNDQVIDNTEKNMKSFESELDDIHGSLTTHTKETADLFVHAKQTGSRLDELEKGITRETDCTLSKYKFQRERELEAIISRSSPLGNLIQQTTQLYLPDRRNIVDFQPVFAGEINVKSHSDTSNVLISNMIATSRDTLLCVDRFNKSVKVVDTENKCLSSQIRLSSGPWDITFVSSDQVAVTLPGIEKIQFLSLKDKKISHSRTIKVNGRCLGIAFHKDTLIAAFVEPAKLETLTLDGKVIRTVSSSPRRTYRLGWPGCLDVSVSENCLYVSDLHENCVLKMSFDGKLLSTFKDDNLHKPRGITVCTDDSVLVCSEVGGVHLLSSESRKIKTLLTAEDVVKCALSVYYNDTTSTLFLSRCDNTYDGDLSNVILAYCQA